MPALMPTDYVGTITWIGYVADRDAALASEGMQSAELTFDGIAGEDHGGLTRASCGRVTRQHPRGTEIRNTRQLSVLSQEELDAIAVELGLEALDPALLGASLVISGIPDFTFVPPSSRLQTESGATLIVDMENRPCNLPAPVIEAVEPGHGKAFKAAAVNRRGVTASVERPGTIAVGDSIRLHIPDQPVWPHLEATRATFR